MKILKNEIPKTDFFEIFETGCRNSKIFLGIDSKVIPREFSQTFLLSNPYRYLSNLQVLISFLHFIEKGAKDSKRCLQFKLKHFIVNSVNNSCLAIV